MRHCLFFFKKKLLIKNRFQLTLSTQDPSPLMHSFTSQWSPPKKGGQVTTFNDHKVQKKKSGLRYRGHLSGRRYIEVSQKPLVLIFCLEWVVLMIDSPAKRNSLFLQVLQQASSAAFPYCGGPPPCQRTQVLQLTAVINLNTCL